MKRVEITTIPDIDRKSKAGKWKIRKKKPEKINLVVAQKGKFVYNYIWYLRQAEIAQLVEHFTRNEGVVGSSPIFSF